MRSVVVKTALKTLLIAVIALIIAFAAASLGFPGQMASLFEKSGAYSCATCYARLAYKYSATVENLARCFDDSVFAGNDENIVEFGDMLVSRDDFKTYAEERLAASESGVSYRNFVYSNLAKAKFLCGDKKGAMEVANTAMVGVTDFPANNAYAILAIQAVRINDGEYRQKIYGLIVNLSPSAEQQNYYNAVLSILT